MDQSVDFAQLASQFDGISGRDIKNAVFQAVVAAAKENKPNAEKCVTQSHLIQAITEIVNANKAASQPEWKLSTVNNKVELPIEAVSLMTGAELS